MFSSIFRFVSSPPSKLKSGGLFWLFFFFLLPAPAVGAGDICFHCKNTIPGCEGGDLCPTIVDIAANAALFACAPDVGANARVIVDRVLPHRLQLAFTQQVCDTIIGLATAPAGGRSVDLSGPAYAASASIVKASLYGHCSQEAALLELTMRMAEADAITLPQIKLAVDVIRARGSVDVIVGGQGVYTYILAKISQIVEGGSSHSYSLQAGVVDNTSGSTRMRLVAKLVRPTNQTRFSELCHYFILAVSAFGLCAFTVVSDFISRTVYEPIRELGLTMSVAFEFMLAHIDEVERDPSRALTLGNVVDKGKQDTHLVKARRNSEAFFRTRGGEPRPEPADDESGVNKTKTKQWNGKDTPTSSKCCAAFNFSNNRHGIKSLLEDGTCRYAHRCNQWVSDKGPRGVCGGSHPKSQCTYDASKRLDQPASA